MADLDLELAENRKLVGVLKLKANDVSNSRYRPTATGHGTSKSEVNYNNCGTSRMANESLMSGPSSSILKLEDGSTIISTRSRSGYRSNRPMSRSNPRANSRSKSYSDDLNDADVNLDPDHLAIQDLCNTLSAVENKNSDAMEPPEDNSIILDSDSDSKVREHNTIPSRNISVPDSDLGLQRQGFDQAERTSSTPIKNVLESERDKKMSKPRSLNKNQELDSERDETSRLSDSSMSLSSEDEDDDNISKYMETMRHIHFLLSSSISSLSDNQDSVYGLDLATENLSDQSVLSSDDTDFYNDWDPGLNGFSNDNSQGNQSSDMHNSDSESEPVREQDLPMPFPHRAQHLTECDICLKVSYVRRRVCCDFQICNKCLATYITLKVKEGKVQMECPNDRCNVLVFKDEIHARLSTSMREKFAKYLIDANADPYIKTCPSCSLPYEIDPALLNVNKRKLKFGLKVVCSQCKLVWCFPCHAPFHSPLSCKKYKKEDEMVRRWAKEKKSGQANAQRCPKCKIYIQKKDGCDHMQCSRCNTDFCYRCGDRYINIKLLGNHWSRFSLFGCKYRLLPEKPALRRLVRGTNFGARLIAAVVLAGLGVAAGAVLLGASVFILPGYGILQLRRNIWARKKRKKFLKQKMLMLAAAQREKELLNCRDILFLDSQGYMTTIPEESETETSNPMSDPQQIQVLVHRSVSFNKDETEDRSKDCDVLVNKYINDGSEVFVSRAVDEKEVAESAKEEDVIMVTDVQEIKNENGYSTVVCNIVSKVNQTTSESEGKTYVEEHDGNYEVLEADVEFHNADIANTIKDKSEDGDQNELSVNKAQISVDKVISNQSHDGSSPAQVTGTDDIPLCHVEKKISREKEEKTKDKEDKSKDKEDKLRDKEITSILSKSKIGQEKAPVSEVIVDKTANNGCFGNIFSSSKRAGSPVPGNQDMSKNESKSSKRKDLFIAKAATWEKCRRTTVDVEPIPKTSVDLTTDLKHLPQYLQKSPSSLSSIISFSYGVDEESKPKGNEPSTPVIKTEALTEASVKKGSEEPHQGDYDASIRSAYVSQYSVVTYL